MVNWLTPAGSCQTFSQQAWSALCCCGASDKDNSVEAAQYLTTLPGHSVNEVKQTAGKELQVTEARNGQKFVAFGDELPVLP